MTTFENLLFTHVDIKTPPKDTDHMHSGHEILIFVSGNSSMNIMGESYSLQPWDLVLIPPISHHYITHHASAPSDSCTYNRMLFYFDLLQNDDFDLREMLSEPRIINVQDHKHLRNLLQRFDDYTTLFGPVEYGELAKTLFSEFLFLLKTLNKSTLPRPANDANPTLKKLLNLILEHYHEDLPIKYYAQQLSYSESYIKNLFSSKMDMGLKHYINSLRVLKAQSLIRRHHKPTSVFQQCGFNNYETFLREYKLFFGHSPSDENPD